MRTLSVEELGRHFASLPGKPRVVVSGNVAVPWAGVRALDENKDTYTIHALNAPPRLRPAFSAKRMPANMNPVARRDVFHSE